MIAGSGSGHDKAYFTSPLHCTFHVHPTTLDVHDNPVGVGSSAAATVRQMLGAPAAKTAAWAHQKAHAFETALA